ncbi:RPGR ORF15 isoform [Zea mays]|uniref:RPGR ORF15 isoform n=1 Tax=Zea mays TaxID=4577 RepID=A0A1D6P202_MAIZE|nr:RPGR ORF15 isoform [Zea mays]
MARRSKHLGQGVVETNLPYCFFRLGMSWPLEFDDQQSRGMGGRGWPRTITTSLDVAQDLGAARPPEPSRGTFVDSSCHYVTRVCRSGDVSVLNLLVPHKWIGVNMLHHSNSRNQRNRGSRIKTLLQATLLSGVVFWLLYQVKHSYDKKNEYLDDAEDQLTHNDRSIFQARKQKAGSYSDSNVQMVVDNSDVTTKPEEGDVDHHSDTFDHNEKTVETVFDKDSTNLHEDDKRNTESSEAEGQVNSGDSNTEANNNKNEDETTSLVEGRKHDTESNSAAESKSEVNSTGDELSQNNHAQEENTREASGMSHDEVAHGDESTSASGTWNGSDGEGEKKEAVDTQTGSETLPDDAKTEATDDRGTNSLSDETGNIPSVHTDNSQNDASENQGDATSTTSDSSEHGISEAVHIETGLEHGSATTSSVTGSETSTNGEQVDPKTETSTSTSNVHNESQGADGSSGSNNSIGNGPEQTGKTERQ